MVQDLGMRLTLVGVDTVREADGLACSSRNRYLTDAQRQIAPQLYAVLCRLRERVAAGEPMPAAEQAAARELTAQGFRPDYVTLRRQQDLAPPRTGDRELVALAAAWLGQARLIDNLEFELNPRA
jgi:pantoate--beta-alanine ligase